MKEYIEFKKQRDLGAIITDMFKFVRLEGKELGKLILRIAGPAMVVMIFCYIYYVQSTLNNFSRIITQGDFNFHVLLSMFLFFSSVVVFYVLLYCTVLLYIKSYIQNEGIVNLDEVRSQVNHYFWSLLGLNLLVGLIVGVGAILCFLPGIYLGVCLALSFPILIFERSDVGAAITNSFKLIKNEWWITFATFIIIYIIYYLVTLIFQIPQIFYYLIKFIVMSNEVSGNPFDTIDWISITLDLIGLLAGYLLFSFILISLAFVYFNLNEKKNYTGAIETIEKLGERDL